MNTQVLPMAPPSARTEYRPDAAVVAQAWHRLGRAFGALNQDWQAHYGVSVEQVSIMRIMAARDAWRLSDLRNALDMHPATLGQTVKRLTARGLVEAIPDPADGRRKVVSVTCKGKGLLAKLPLIGPDRLLAGEASADPRLADAFHEAVDAFGLSNWV